MSVHSGHHQTSTRTTTYHTTNAVNAVSASPEPLTSNITISAESVSPLPYALNGGNYETVRYLVPMQGNMQSVQQQACYYPIQQQQSYIPIQQQQHLIPIQQQQQFIPIQQAQQQQSFYIMQQPQQQMLSPVYLQTLPRVSVSSHESDSVFNQTTTQVDETEVDGEDESEAEEEDEENGDQQVVVDETVITTTISQNTSSSYGDMTTDLKEMHLPEKMDPRYFGELLAEVYRKNVDIHSCIFDHVSKIRGQKHQLDPSNDYKCEKDEVESLLPKGSSELTKQQIRYLLQTRLVADKSMRLLLSTFSSLREELLRMSEDLRRLEMEKDSLERDLSFKADQAQQYDLLLEAVRENNRQLQMSLKESSAAQRNLESQLSSSQSSSSSHEFMMQDLEGRLRALENENNMLKQQLASQGSSKSDMLAQTDALSRQFKDQLDALRREKDAEIARLRSEMSTFQSQSSQQSSSDQTLKLKISELLATLDKRQTTITTQEEELRRLRTEKSSWSSSNKNVSKTTVNTSSSFTNRYPMLRLLSDDYEAKISSPRESRTFTYQKTG